MKPIIILQPGSMSKEGMDSLRANELCVVEAKDPSLVKFVDPIPSISSRTEIENAAIQLSRKVMHPNFWAGGVDASARMACVRAFVDILVKGSPLDFGKTQQEVEREIFTVAKQDEIRRLAREEAKAERAALKADKKADKK